MPAKINQHPHVLRRSMKRLFTPFLLIVVLLFGLSGCIISPKETPLEGDARDQVLAYSEDMSDHLLQAINTGDYSAFSRDLSPVMAKTMSEQEFNKMRASLAPKIGDYQSREVKRVDQIGNDIAVTYTATYSLEDGVSVRVVFDSAEPHLITGLWFDSPNLRKK